MSLESMIWVNCFNTLSCIKFLGKSFGLKMWGLAFEKLIYFLNAGKFLRADFQKNLRK